MENATQALRIAAGVLFAMLILGLLVVFYNNMSELKRFEESQIAGEQIADFNKQYDVYKRTLYGSELLSLVNKADDYNKTETYEGYQRLEVTVTFKNNMTGYVENSDGTKVTEFVFFKKGKEYNIEEITTVMKNLEDEIKNWGNSGSDRAGKKISELALMRSNEIDDWFDKIGISDTVLATKIKYNIRLYEMYKSTEVTIKSKKYKFENISYDNTTGRITKLSYKEL